MVWRRRNPGYQGGRGRPPSIGFQITGWTSLRPERYNPPPGLIPKTCPSTGIKLANPLGLGFGGCELGIYRRTNAGTLVSYQTDPNKLLAPMRASNKSSLLFFAAFMLVTAGCYFPVSDRTVYVTEPQPRYAPAANVPTALVVVVEGESTEMEYQARRNEIVNYLIERGYISREEDLIGDPANADRIIRAIVSNGGFTLSVFNQNPAGPPPVSLETTDILYPADPYYILGFYYVDEIGPRRLPPCPPDYRPHPRPPYEGPPPGREEYDHDRHWSHPGQREHDDDRRAPSPDRRRGRDENHPTAPALDRRSDDRTQPRPDNRVQPPDRRPRDQNQPPANQTGRPSAPAPDRKPDARTQLPRPDDHAKQPPKGLPPKPADRPRSEDDRHPSRPSTTPKSADHSQAPNIDRRPSGNPPPSAHPPAQPVQPRPAPAPEMSNDTERKDPPAGKKDNRVQQN